MTTALVHARFHDQTTLDPSNAVRSPIVESPFGWHLNVRAPDNIAVELLAMKPEASAALYGSARAAGLLE